jgi:hypothetical protein
MLRKAAVLVVVVLALCGSASAGVLSATDIQRLRDYEQFVIPADREIPQLRDMAARIDTLVAMVEGPGDAIDGGRRSDFRSLLRDLPNIGGPTLEKMLSSLNAIQDPGIFARPEWVAMLNEVKAEAEEHLAYDSEVLKAYQRSTAAGAPGVGPSFIRWEERPNAGVHWTRLQEMLGRAH